MLYLTIENVLTSSYATGRLRHWSHRTNNGFFKHVETLLQIHSCFFSQSTHVRGLPLSAVTVSLHCLTRSMGVTPPHFCLNIVSLSDTISIESSDKVNRSMINTLQKFGSILSILFLTYLFNVALYFIQTISAPG